MRIDYDVGDNLNDVDDDNDGVLSQLSSSSSTAASLI